MVCDQQPVKRLLARPPLNGGELQVLNCYLAKAGLAAFTKYLGQLQLERQNIGLFIDGVTTACASSLTRNLQQNV